jgi:hypothetical protein
MEPTIKTTFEAAIFFKKLSYELLLRLKAEIISI